MTAQSGQTALVQKQIAKIYYTILFGKILLKTFMYNAL